MVKEKTPGREAYRTQPITKYFLPVQNNNKNSEISAVSNKHDIGDLSYKSTITSKKSIRKDHETPKRNKSGCTTPETSSKSLNVAPESPLNSQVKNNAKIQKEVLIISDDDDDSKSIPEVIEDDEDDELLSKADVSCIPTKEKNISIEEESSENFESNLRRSSRPRRVVFQEGFVRTVDAIPMKGDIPTLDVSSSPTKENNTTKPTYQNSLSALLREKRIRDKAGYNINVLEQALENDMLDEMEDPFDSYVRSDISASLFQEDVKTEHLQQILEEDDRFDQNHQIEFFGNFNSNPQVPNLQSVTLANSDPTLELLLKESSDEEKLKDIICYNWIAYQYEIGWQVPTEAIVWLLHLASYGGDKIISEGSFNTLKNIAEIKGSHSCSLRNETEDINVPFSEVYSILTVLGASTQIISSQYCLEQNVKQISLFDVPSRFHYINNVRQLLKTLVPMIDNRLFTFSSSEEIRAAIVILLRLPLDKRLLSLSNEVEQVLDSLLSMFQEDQWIEQAKLICDDVEFSCGSITQFKVAMLEYLPISNRGRLLRRFFAFRFLFGFALLSQQIDILNVTEPETLKSLLDLFQDNLTVFKIRDGTNYNDLYNYVLLLDYALDDESQLRKAKDTVEEIIKKLKYLHGKIVDMRAAFMERTRAKDLIQRLYMRLYYISNHQRGKTQASILFYSPKENQKTLDMDMDKKTDNFQII